MSATVRVGTAGWSYPDWKGVVYPLRASQGFDELAYLASFVDVIEINSTFYRPPQARHAERWAGVAANLESFRFTAKLSREFTHAAPEQWDSGAISAFRMGFEPLVESGGLAALLAQFPFFFEATPEHLEHLRQIAHTFDFVHLVVEVRHNSFLKPAVMARLTEFGLSFCNIDQPLGRTSIGPGSRVTGPVGYLRLHGRNRTAWFRKGAGRDAKYDYLYSPRELRGFVPLIRELRARTEETFVVTNNHFLGKAPANALELKALLEGSAVAVPRTLAARYPRLQSLPGEVPHS